MEVNPAFVMVKFSEEEDGMDPYIRFYCGHVIAGFALAVIVLVIMGVVGLFGG